MKRTIRQIMLWVAVIGVSLPIIGLVMYAVGARINTSSSIPIGLYWMSGASIKKGEYVIFCPPQSAVFETARERGYINAGFCPGNYGFMMKKILAAKGDTMSITPRGVTINGTPQLYSKPFAVDSIGRKLPHLNKESYTLQDTEILLMADRSPTSFDARYFGQIDIGQAKSVIRPIVTF